MTANAGYHAYATGDVLTAAQVQYNLQNQTVMYFASSAARTTALTGVLVEGMVSYIPANGLEYYNGSAWVVLSTGGDITGVTAGKGLTGGGTTGDVTVSLGTTAKGDLVVGTGASTAGVLSVSSDGSTIVADSSTSTGLRYQGNYAAGKNKIINGDFGIWQRGTSFSATGSSTYTADRWTVNAFGGTTTVSRQTFTPGTAPVAGYEGSYFLRFASSATFADLIQKIEDVRTFAGQTVAVSFWAKAASALTLNPTLSQDFGSGGSSAVDTGFATQSITTSWARYTATISVPSISGKTIGTGSSLWLYFLSSTLNTNIDIWGVQLEAGSVATAFQTATGTLQGELAACQRYYYRANAGASYEGYAIGMGSSATNVAALFPLKQTLRTVPSAVDYGGSIESNSSGVGAVAITAITLGDSGFNQITINCTSTSGITATRPYVVRSAGNTTSYIGFSAEL